MSKTQKKRDSSTQKKRGPGGRPVISGYNAKQKTQLSSEKDIKIAANVNTETEVPAGAGMSGYMCTCCGKVFASQQGNFPPSSSILYAGNNGYLSVCKLCVELYYHKVVEFYSNNEEHALEHCCRVFDWYYSNSAAAMTIVAANAGSRIAIYPSKMNMTQVKAKGTTYFNTLKERNTDGGVIKISDVGEKTKTTSYKASEDVLRFWGEGHSNLDYEFLDREYKDWSQRYECETKAQEELFKAICMSQLTMQRAQRSGDIKEITNAAKTFQDLLNTAGLKPNKDGGAAGQNLSFGQWIKKIENERPISEPKEEWKDVDGIHKYIDTYFLGHLCNLMHIKNDKEAEYLKEMEKYTVVPPEYKDNGDLDDEDDGDYNDDWDKV